MVGGERDVVCGVPVLGEDDKIKVNVLPYRVNDGDDKLAFGDLKRPRYEVVLDVDYNERRRPDDEGRDDGKDVVF
jgi:hypothetical protein